MTALPKKRRTMNWLMGKFLYLNVHTCLMYLKSSASIGISADSVVYAEDLENLPPSSFTWEEPEHDETFDQNFADTFVHAASHQLVNLSRCDIAFTPIFSSFVLIVLVQPQRRDGGIYRENGINYSIHSVLASWCKTRAPRQL